MSELITDEIVEAAVRIISPSGRWDAYRDARLALEAAAPLIAARALEEAADDWQRGEWADAPRRFDQVQERIATAQHVTEWLRQRAARQKEGRG